MLEFLFALLAGLSCGVLSGLGIGGGTLLMLWLTAVLSFEQRAAQGINLLYFLPTAACSLIFHIKNRRIVWRAAFPAAISGCVSAVFGAVLSGLVETALLRRLFGVFLIVAGLCELFLKGRKK